MERLISYYNILKTQLRSSLSSETIKDSLYIKINMTCLSQFNPHPAVIYWLKQKNRHEKAYTNVMKQEWFQGVFPDAAISKGTIENKSTKACF